MVKEYLNQTQRKFMTVLIGIGFAQWGLMADKVGDQVWMQAMISMILILSGATVAEKIWKKD